MASQMKGRMIWTMKYRMRLLSIGPSLVVVICPSHLYDLGLRPQWGVSGALGWPVATSNLDVELEGAKSIETQNQMTPNAFQVESLLSEICDTSSIAEFELKFGGFRLYVTRNVYGKDTPSPLQNHFPLGTDMAIQASDSNGSVSSQSLAISKPAASGGESLTLLEKASDKGLKILNSPRVGFFRRSRIIKGKRAPPPCKENQIVKEGQVLCYIEQLGGQIPIESDVAGEVVKILKKDGEPVGYGDALMEILPSFPGIKKLQ
ncbi:hypothetical protein ACHQM5_025188 [Ranunculus cassubicifolius]